MDKEAERFCRGCHSCQIVARPDVPEPLRPSVLPEGPWQDIAVDLLGPFPSGHTLLVAVDYYSRYYEVRVLTGTSSAVVIDHLDDIFDTHGLPMTLKSDNGPQFRSTEFQDFCAENGIIHLKTTARWAQANGEVERQNHSIVKRLKIAQAEKKPWRKELRKYLRKYRNLEHPSTGKAPSELIFGRKLRDKLPCISDASSRYDQDVRDRDAETKAKSKYYADNRRNAAYSEIGLGDKVLMKQDKVDKLTPTFNPVPYQVVKKMGNSTVVESPDGQRYSRNTQHLKKFVTPSGGADSPQDSQPVPQVPVEHPGAGPPATPERPTVTVPMTPKAPAVPTTYTPARPRRETKAPSRFKDFAMT